MQFKSSILALTLIAYTTLVASRDLQAPANPTLGAQTQVHWTVDPVKDKPFWTLFLMDPTYIWGLYAILGENIDNSVGYVNVTVPATLDTGLNYVLKAVDPNNVDIVYNTSPVFQVNA